MSNRKIFRKLAKQNKVSVEEVRKDMQSALDHAYRRDDKTNEIKTVQNRVERKGNIPTVDEFLNDVRNNKNKK